LHDDTPFFHRLVRLHPEIRQAQLPVVSPLHVES
jgi:hypothetical protein